MGTSLFNTTPAATYPALIKVGDNTSIDGTLKTLSDGAGNDLPIQVSSTATNFTGTVGVASQLYLGNTNSLLSTNRFQILNAANTAIMVNVDTGGSLSTTGRFQIYNSARTSIAQAMYYDGSSIIFRPMNDGVESTRFSNNAQDKTMIRMDGVSGNVDIGTATTLGARLGIKGSGSTFATTSFLVQNSSGSQLMNVTDDGSVTIGTQNGVVSIISGYNNKFEQNRLSLYSAQTNIRGIYEGNQGLIVSKQTGISDLYPSSIFAIDSTDQGFLPPRMTNAQRTAIASPAVGLMVYCTDATEGLYVYKSTGWTFVI